LKQAKQDLELRLDEANQKVKRLEEARLEDLRKTKKLSEQYTLVKREF
jgi:hypothetical protein